MSFEQDFKSWFFKESILNEEEEKGFMKHINNYDFSFEQIKAFYDFIMNKQLLKVQDIKEVFCEFSTKGICDKCGNCKFINKVFGVEKKRCSFCNAILIGTYEYDNKPCCEQCVGKVFDE